MYVYMYPCTCLPVDSVHVVGLFECWLCFVSSSECLFSRLDLCSLVFSLPAISHFPKSCLMQLKFFSLCKYRGWGALDNECTIPQITSAGCLSQHLYSVAIHIHYIHVHVGCGSGQWQPIYYILCTIYI